MSTYDALPYEDYAHPEATPAHLAAVAWMFGHPAAPPARARVLEIGCATGGHLLPLAEAFPEAQFVGVDLSAAQIAQAEAHRDALGLGNVTLLARSFTDLDDSLGRFDYVLCHGVWSWVSPALQSRLLDAVRARLAPEGVALVSYNTLPGWSVGLALRDYLRQHIDAALPAAAQVERARGALALLLAPAAVHDGAVLRALRAEARRALDADASYLFHEYLEADNHPVYLRDFVAAARASGLGYLGDAKLPRNLLGALGAPHAVAMDQTADFLHARRFRAAMLVHGDRPPARRPDPAVLAALRWSTPFTLAADADAASLRRDEPLAFTDGARTLTLHEPLAKCVLVALVEAEGAPCTVSALCDAAAERLGAPGLRGESGWLVKSVDLAGWALDGVVCPHAIAPRYVTAVSPRPVASAWARRQVGTGAHGTQDVAVTTRRHTQVALDAFSREVVKLLDGHHDRAALVDALRPGHPDAELPARCEAALALLARNALLCG